MRRAARLSLLPLLAVMLSASTAHANEFFHTVLGPRPQVESSGSGQGSFTLDRFGESLEFTITVEGLSSPEVGAHIHRPDGVIAFDLPPGPVKAGVWQDIGFGDLFLLREEQLYVLVHTQANPGGELRGSIRAGAVAVERTSFGAVKALYERWDARRSE